MIDWRQIKDHGMPHEAQALRGDAEATGRRKRILRGAAVAAAALASMLGDAAAAGSDWDAVVKAATAEGEIDVHGGPGEVYEQVLADGFRRAYPEIKINFSGLTGRDAIPKIIREREAALYHWDIYIGGTFSILQNLKPAGALAPLRPALILPEVLDDAAWYGGLDGGWMDKERTYVLSFEATVTPLVMVNWDFVARSDLKTYDDLFKAQFAGKMAWDDPRLPGEGSAAAQRLLVNFGADFLKRLFTEQTIVYTANPRQNAEWVVRGRYPIGIGAAAEQFVPFWRQGLGRNIAGFDPPLPHPMIAVAFGTISLMDHAPHPNAAKVYINWLLSKAAQTEWAKTGHNSRRFDVPHAEPELFPKPGIAYIAEQAEENIHLREEAANIAKQLISAQP